MHKRESNLLLLLPMQHNSWKCLIIDDVHPALLTLLESADIRYHYQPGILPEEVSQVLHSYEILVVRSKLRVTEALLQHAPALRLVARAGAGIDNLDEQALTKRNITIVNAPEGNRDAVAEHTIAMLLALLNNLTTADRQVREKIWLREPNRGTELGDKTVGIIGFGNMGQSFAKRLVGFGCTVLAYDKYHPVKSNQNANGATLAEIFEQADIVSLHVPLTTETNRMVTENWLQNFSKKIWLLNTSRGEVTDQQALAQALKKGKLLGLALDVLENEKLQTLNQLQQQSFEYLASQPNVLFSPHIAGWTHESYERISKVLGAKILEYCKSSE